MADSPAPEARDAVPGAGEAGSPVLISHHGAASIFVHGIWLVLSVAALGLVLRYGVNAPFIDDFLVVPVLAGEEPISLEWLWRQHSDHRFPLVKLVIWGATAGCGGDFRAVMVLNAAGLSAASLILIRAARVLRGRTEFADAFFPVLLLHWGHAGNMLRCVIVEDVLIALFLSLLLLRVAGMRSAETRVDLLVLGTCLAGCSLLGTPGLVLGTSLAPWGLFRARWLLRSSPGPRPPGGAWALLALGVPLLVGAAYFLGFERIPHPPLGESLPGVPRFVAQAIGGAFGSLGVFGWGGEGFGAGWPPLPAILAVAFTLATLALLFRRLWRRAEDPVRTAWLLAFPLSLLLLAAAMGFGRAGFGETYAIRGHYMLRMVPLMAGLYLAWEVLGQAPLARLVQTSLLAATLSVLAFNMQSGFQQARDHRVLMDDFSRDLREGMDDDAILRRYCPAVYPFPEPLRDYLRMMRRGRVAPFR